MNERRLTDAELEASRWIARLEAPDVSLEDHQRFRAWLEAAPENRPAYDAVSRSWDKFDALKFLSPADVAEALRPREPAEPPEPPEPPEPAPKARSRRALLMGGGALALAGGAALSFWALTPAITFAANYETGIGGREQAALQDGSRIELNADTSMRVAFTTEKRSVDLTRGEALFHVASDRRPFEVRTPFGALIAEGASFLVKLGPTSVRATILSGRVRGPSSATAGAATRASGALAGQNEELLLTRAAAEHLALPADRANQRLAWREHMLSFDGETLLEAAADVERQTGIRFAFSAPSIAAMRVGGYIDGRDAGAFAQLIEANLGLSARRQSDGSFVVTD